MLGSKVIYAGNNNQQHGKDCSVIAWGRKPSSVKAEKYAKQYHLPLLRIEDGFLRSIELGNKTPPLSIVVDDIGIYYDSTRPSRLEKLIPLQRSKEEQLRAESLMPLWRSSQVSKYNDSRNLTDSLPDSYVLVIDQTYGDHSITLGSANQDSFKKMLSTAIEKNPESTIIVKVHPDVVNGRKRGHFDLEYLKQLLPRVQVLAKDIHPASLIQQSKAIYTVTSQVGFEGLLWGKPVYTFGMPFYAGWGLTSDDLTAPEQRIPVTLQQLVYASLIEYPRYLDPEISKPCNVERLIKWVAFQRKMRERFPSDIYAIEFSWYKRRVLKKFFQGSKLHFIRRTSNIPSSTSCAIWGSRKLDTTHDKNISLLRLEDGFLRSVGLGADLTQPLSWIIDQRGIYYDSTTPSDLEYILQNHEFDDVLLSRAHSLSKRLASENLTKYNVGLDLNHSIYKRLSSLASSGKRLILVPGQVESDKSLAHGAPGIRQNLALLRAVRNASPAAYIIYKPHPDVLSGLRSQGAEEDRCSEFCDELVTNISIGELLPLISEVHTMTSLTGFEALLRGKPVTCYGQPFYSSWGLTSDIQPVARRTRKLSIDQLVAGALILYPTYISKKTSYFTTPERAMDELLAWRKKEGTILPWWRWPVRLLLRLMASVR